MNRSIAEIIREDIGRLCRISGTAPSPYTGLLPGERRNVTILFLDIQGFSSLAEKLDHETVHLIIDGVMGALARVVEIHGGYVDKFEGDLVMALFGARRAGEKDAMRAVSCGFRMLETLTEANTVLKDTGIILNARVGISSGNVTVAPDPSGHMTATGDEVNLARRMEAAATPGTILATSIVRDECRGEFLWKPMGSVEVKGISRLIDTYRPEETRAFHLGLPPAGKRPEDLFVGRQVELKELKQHFYRYLQRYTAHRENDLPVHSLLLIRGSAGSGKSRLLERFLSLDPPDLKVLRGRCVSFAQPPYFLWTAILTDLLRLDPMETVDPDRLKYLLQEAIGAGSLPSRLARGIPFLGALLPGYRGSGAHENRQGNIPAGETEAALGGLLNILLSKGPMVLVLEDLHYADEASLSVIRSLLSGIHCHRPLMMTGLKREDVSAEEQELTRTITEAAQHVSSLTLRPMDEREMRKLIDVRLGEVTPLVRKFLTDRSRGNPYFLEEMIRDLTESGTISCIGNIYDLVTDTGDLNVPSSLEGVLQSRIDRLSHTLKLTLQCASVLGTEFPEEVFRRIMEELKIEEKLDENLSELRKRGFLIYDKKLGEGTYRFTNPLLKDTVYSLLLHYNRQLLHRTAAEVLSAEAVFKEKPNLLAIHHYRAGNMKEAFSWGMKALRLFVRSSQNYKVMEWSSRLQRWLREHEAFVPENHDLLEILQRRQLALLFLGRVDDAEDLLMQIDDIAGRTGDTATLVKVCNSSARFHIIRHELNLARERLERSFSLCRKLNDPHLTASTLFFSGLLHKYRGQNTRAEELYREALKHSKRSSDGTLTGSILGNLGIVVRISGRMKEAMELYRAALARYREDGNKSDETIVLYNIANIHSNAGDLAEGEKAYRKVIANAEETGDMRILCSALGALGTVYSESGDMERGLKYLTRAERVGRRIGDLHSAAWHITNRAEIHLKNGQWDRAEEEILESLKLARECSAQMMIGYDLSLQARVLVHHRRLDEALSKAQEGNTILEEKGYPSDRAIALISLGLVNAARGDTGLALQHYHRAADIISRQEIAQNVFTGLKDLRDLIADAGGESPPLPDGWDQVSPVPEARP